MTVIKKAVVMTTAAVVIAGIVVGFKILDVAVKAFPLSTRPNF